MRGLALFAAASVLVHLVGCSSLNLLSTVPNESTVATGQTKLTYRTRSDRLIHSPVGSSPQHQVLPGVCTCTLVLTSPHPSGVQGIAHVRLHVRPIGGDDDLTAEGDTPLVGRPVEMDIPRWQADGIISKLKKDGFFRRTKTLDPKSFLAVNSSELRFAKRYRAVDELDAMILRAATWTPAERPHVVGRESQRQSDVQNAPVHISRLPPVEPH